MFDIVSWNINPNQDWYVRLSDGGIGITVALYDTLADAQAQANIVAAGISIGYGSDVEVTLGIGVSFFQDSYSWHLRVSGTAGGTVQTYLVKQFVDLDEIDNPLFRNSALVTIRATAEIDEHTHGVISYNVDVGTHYTDLEPGDVITLSSSRRNLSKALQIFEHSISYSIDDTGQASLQSNLTVNEYIALKR